MTPLRAKTGSVLLAQLRNRGNGGGRAFNRMAAETRWPPGVCSSRSIEAVMPGHRRSKNGVASLAYGAGHPRLTGLK